jgi:hypothetical protein
MKRTLTIFEKDATHLWPQIVAFVATLALFACEDPTYTKHEDMGLVQLTNLLYLVLPLSCWLLVTSVMQEEKAVGHEQYWLARPFTWVDLLAAKALFLLAFVIVPVFVCQELVLDANGFSAIEHFGELLVKQVFFAALLLLPMAAMGAVTKNLGHAFLGGLLVSIVLTLGSGVTAAFAPGSNWGALPWIRETVVAAVALCGAAAVIYLQYTRRRAALGRAVLAGVAVLVLAVWTLSPWQPAFAIQSWFSTQRIDPQAVRISFDPRPEKSSDVHSRTGVYVTIPVRLENVPRDLEAESDWASIESPWRSGWSTSSWLRSDASGIRWLVVSVDADYFERAKDAPVRLRGSLDLTLFAPSGSPSSFGCWTETSTFYCLSPLPRMRLTEVWSEGNASANEVHSPFPTSPWFGLLEKYSTPDTGPTLIADRPVAYIQRSFDLGPLRLSDYRAAFK